MRPTNNMDQDWCEFAAFSDAASAEVVAGLLRGESVPVHVASDEPIPGLVRCFRVLVPPDMLHRAKWIAAQAELSEEELTFLATGELSDGQSPPEDAKPLEARGSSEALGGAMKVADHEPRVWFLLEKSGRYYLDARVTRSGAEWSILIELTPQEYREYHAIGRLYLNYLAARIHNFAEEYSSRDLNGQIGGEVTRVIQDWRESSA